MVVSTGGNVEEEEKGINAKKKVEVAEKIAAG